MLVVVKKEVIRVVSDWEGKRSKLDMIVLHVDAAYY
jgi:hypothetical protein